MSKSTIRGDFKDAAAIGGVRMALGFFGEALLRIVSSVDVVTTSYVKEKLDETFGGDASPGAIYSTLQRLEKDGVIKFLRASRSQYEEAKQSTFTRSPPRAGARWRNRSASRT